MTLTPTFDGAVTEYTATTTNASNKVTATAAEGLTIEILNGETEVENGGSASWEEGDNTLTITVSNGTDDEVYTVTVTRGEG